MGWEETGQLFAMPLSVSPFISLLHVFSVIDSDICVHSSYA